MIAEIPSLRNSASSPLKKRCPDCGSLLLLEPVYGDGYWWSCLICGWHKPAEGVEPRRNRAQSPRVSSAKTHSTRPVIPSRN